MDPVVKAAAAWLVVRFILWLAAVVLNVHLEEPLAVVILAVDILVFGSAGLKTAWRILAG
jgi:hypothetical protein